MKKHQLISLLSEYPEDYEVMFMDEFERDGYICKYNTTVEDVEHVHNEDMAIVNLLGRNLVRNRLKKQIDEVTDNMDICKLKEILHHLFNWRMK